MPAVRRRIGEVDRRYFPSFPSCTWERRLVFEAALRPSAGEWRCDWGGSGGSATAGQAVAVPKCNLGTRIGEERKVPWSAVFDGLAGRFSGAAAGADFDANQDRCGELFPAFFLFARSVFDGTTLGVGQRVVVLLFAHPELGQHPGFFVKHFSDRGRLIPAVFLIGERLEGAVEGKRKGDRNGGGFLVSHSADRVTANMAGQENSILTGV